MSNSESSTRDPLIAVIAAVIAFAALVPVARAQTAPPAAYPPAPTYPQQSTYPQQQPAYPQQPGFAPQPATMDPQMAAQMQTPHPIRALFAGTIATLLQASGTSLAAGLTQGVAGGIANWFQRKNKSAQYGQQVNAQGYPSTTSPYSAPTNTAYPSTAYSPTTYPSTTPAYSAAPAYPNSTPSDLTAQSPAYPTTTPAYPATQTYPPTSPAYPTASTTTSSDPYAATTPAAYPAAANAYAAASSTYPSTTPSTSPATTVYPGPNLYAGQTAGAYPAVQVYDAQTGQAGNAAGTAYATSSSGNDGTLYAGIAYEVHALGPGATTTPVNPATYAFRSGDRFLIYYRPSMPGRLEVFNINPAGQRTRIDAANMAAGQLATLGPYEFNAMTGDESLQIVLSACSTPQLLVATRDIVNVAAAPATTSGVQLGTCGAPATRGLEVKTRDIQKVAVDSGTAFALDPVSAGELSAGQIAARAVNIVFHHL